MVDNNNNGISDKCNGPRDQVYSHLKKNPALAGVA